MASSFQIDRQRALRAIGLFGLLVAIYFLTYSGGPVSSDEEVIFDGAHSALNYGTLELAYTSPLRPYWTQPANQVVAWLDVEPMQAYAAVPLLWLAERIPGIGLVQTAWTLNIWITALAAVVLYYYGVALHYKDRTALAVALLFGLATTVWPYSAMFFREPLFMLAVLTCAYGLEKARQHLDQGQYRLGWFALAGLSLAVVLLTKEAGLLLAPFLLLVALPGAVRRLFSRRVLIALAVVAILLVVGVLLLQRAPGGRYNDILGRFARIDLDYFGVAVAGYLISPGFSLWAFSPVLLLGWGGVFLLLKQRRSREILVPLALLVTLTVGYALLQGPNWYGGKGWGPRYLLPIVPFLCLWLLPLVEHVLDRRAPAWVQAVSAGTVVYSLFVQILGATVSVNAFGNYLYQQQVALGRPISPWIEGTWNLLYIPPIVAAHETGLASRIAWIVNNTGGIVVPLCLITAALSLFALTRPCLSWRKTAFTGGLIGLSLVISVGVGLRSYYLDPRYGADTPILWTALDKINAGLRPGDAVILNDSAYASFFRNYYKASNPIYILPDALGEILMPGQPPVMDSPDPDLRAHPATSMLLGRLAQITSRWWFLTEFTPYSKVGDDTRRRPTEQFLVRHYFPIQEVLTDNVARLILFSTASAPQDPAAVWPQIPVNADFGAARLVGIDLPRGDTFKPGDSLPVSMLWYHQGWPSDLAPFEYSFNLSLIDKSGVAAAQEVAPLGWTFAPLPSWPKGVYYRDNRAVELPPDLAPGDYDLWALLFDWRDSSRLRVRNAASGAPTDHVVIAKIHVGK